MISPNNAVLDEHYLVFSADGTGFSLGSFADSIASGKLEFTWKNLGYGKYEAVLADTKGTGLPAVLDLTLKDGVLSHAVPKGTAEYHAEPVSEYIVGLWESDTGDFGGYEDIKSMMYFNADGTGKTIVYGMEVMGLADVYIAGFTWEEKDGVLSLVGEKGYEEELTVKDGLIYLDGIEAYHQYVITDHLIGLWTSVNQYVEDGVSYDIVLLIRSDGTGVEMWTLPDSHVASEKYYFTWVMTSATSLHASYDDGDVWDFYIDRLQLTDGDMIYDKVGFVALGEYAKASA